MEGYAFIDTNPGSESSHTVEAKKGFDTVAKASLEKNGNEWYVYEVFTKDSYRGQGIAKEIVAYIEQNYGPIVLNSDNDPFWVKMGYVPYTDGYWRRPPYDKG